MLSRKKIYSRQKKKVAINLVTLCKNNKISPSKTDENIRYEKSTRSYSLTNGLSFLSSVCFDVRQLTKCIHSLLMMLCLIVFFRNVRLTVRDFSSHNITRRMLTVVNTTQLIQHSIETMQHFRCDVVHAMQCNTTRNSLI